MILSEDLNRLRVYGNRSDLEEEQGLLLSEVGFEEDE